MKPRADTDPAPRRRRVPPTLTTAMSRAGEDMPNMAQGSLPPMAWLLALSSLLVLAIACAAVLAAPLPPAPSAADQQAAFDAGAAVGQASAASGAAGLRNGSSEATLKATVPAYSASPPVAGRYSPGDAARQASALRADCAAGAASAADGTCAALTLGQTRRDLSGAGVSSQTLVGQAAADDPKAVLGTVSSVYSACTTGSVMVSPATYARTSCALQVEPWTIHSCDKTITAVHPVSTQSCQPGEVLDSRSVTAVDGRSTITLTARCSSATPALVDVAITSVDNTLAAGTSTPDTGCTGQCDPGPAPAACASSVTRRVDLDALATTGVAFGTVNLWGSYVGAPDYYAKPACLPVPLSLSGPGCSAGTCQVRLTLQPSPSNDWVYPVMPSAALSFPQPHAVPASGDVWTNGCASFEARSAWLAPDGTPATAATSMPVAAEPGTPQCVRTSSTCTDGPATRMVDGVPVTRACWHYAESFACTAVAAGSTCGSSPPAGCRQVAAGCTATDPATGLCLSVTDDFECKTADAVFKPALDCGGSSYCADGSCFSTGYRPDDRFAYAIAQLQARKDAGKDFDTATLKIFVGADRRCDRKAFGIDDCCDSRAYITHCADADKTLREQRDQGRCHEVGTYCSNSSFLGLCRTHTTSFCCFSSLLARVVQEQGRLQLGHGWGNADDPACAGMSPEEFAGLDWSRMDLSEFYAQIQVDPPALGSAQGSSASRQPGCYHGQGKC